MVSNQVDVVVVGYGGAGGSAAIAAHDAGARVLLIEKMEQGGGSTHEAGGTLRPPRDAELAARHYAMLSGNTTPIELMRAFAFGEQALPGRIRELGGELGEFELPSAPWPARRHETAYPEIEGAEGLGDRVRVAPEHPGQGGGEALWNLLSRNVDSRGIEVALGWRGSALLHDASGRVTGIEVSSAGGATERVTAKGGVILCCGGFAHNSAMKVDALGADIGALSPAGRNTGDGIVMATQVGATLWHMNAVSCTFGYRFPGQVSAFYAQMPANGYFIVDQAGKRFCSEAGVENHAAFNLLGVRNPYTGWFDRIPAYIIFDDMTRVAGQIFNPKTGANRHYPWSSDNSAEVESGWITSAPTLAELADKLGLPRGQFLKTADEYARIAGGAEDWFGRPSDKLAPVENSPFYGVALWPCLLNTQGGPRRDEKARVLDSMGNPIFGLFSAGEIGSLWGPLYPGSGNVAEAVVFGRVAGENAATGVASSSPADSAKPERYRAQPDAS